MKLSDNIKKLRSDKGILQDTLASYLNVTPQAVSRWESGRTTPDIAMLPTPAAYFGVSIDALMSYAPSEEERVRVIGVLSAEFQYKSPPERLAAGRVSG